ncbi:MAG: PhzF family phenazine biosynthesis protein [Rhodospirillaceae bacterium]|nr:PhzF family phenazine biosynthesis protein [Rhodospirillaceae bacterium]MBT7355598.1 PhzF family phenazine biosynthesis protein [Rhodospirillaceae bacterium]
MTNAFYIVDVFAEAPYCGNPLAVVICEAPLSDESMQKIALETNYSETTFVSPLKNEDGGYRVRIFTPSREIDFAGHPLLGTAHVIRYHIQTGEQGPVRLNLPVGQVEASFNAADGGKEVVWFEAPPVTPGIQCSHFEIATALGLDADDMDEASPVQQMTAGISAVMVPVSSLDALSRARLNLDAYAPLKAEGFAPLTYVFCKQTQNPENDLSVRFFFEAHGVREDPATGNGAAFFGAYALNHGLYGERDISLRIEQGHFVHRPSVVMLQASGQDAGQQISVGGHVEMIVQGKLI